MQLAAKQLAEDWNKKLAGEIMPVLTLPGHRLANAEAAVAHLAEFCAAAGAAQRKRIEKQYEVVKKVREELQSSLMQCQGGTGRSCSPPLTRACASASWQPFESGM